MLPNLPAHGGISLFPFDQALDFPIGIASTMSEGVCSGLSLLWIKKHKLGQAHTFRAQIRTPSSIKDVENVQSKIGGFASLATSRMLREAGLTIGVGKDITSDVTAARVAAALAMTQGYEYASFVNGAGQHTIALARQGGTVELFDSNYGCARFATRDAFKAWFQADYWGVNGGPGPGCTRFIVLSLY